MQRLSEVSKIASILESSEVVNVLGKNLMMPDDQKKNGDCTAGCCIWRRSLVSWMPIILPPIRNKMLDGGNMWIGIRPLGSRSYIWYFRSGPRHVSGYPEHDLN